MRSEGGQPRAQEPGIGTGEKQRCPEAEVGDLVAMTSGEAVDQTVETQASKVIGHLPGAYLAAEQGAHLLTQVAVGEASG